MEAHTAVEVRADEGSPSYGFSSCCLARGSWPRASPLQWLGDGDPPAGAPPVDRAREWRDRRRPASRSCPPVLITLELRRIEAEIHRVEASDARTGRRAFGPSSAYDQLLLQLCEPRGRPTPGLPRCPSGERLAIEAELVAAGHEW